MGNYSLKGKYSCYFNENKNENYPVNYRMTNMVLIGGNNANICHYIMAILFEKYQIFL